MKKLLAILTIPIVVLTGCTCIGQLAKPSAEPSDTPTTEEFPAASPPVINFFAARPSSILPGESTTLTWNVEGVSSVTIDQGIGRVRPTGTAAVSPTKNIVYVLTATNSYGTDTARVRIVLMGQETPATKPVIEYFVASPSVITPGQPVSVSWKVANATTVTPNWKGSTLASAGNDTVSPVVTIQYTITATNKAGSSQASLIVTVTQEQAEPQPQPQPAVGLPVIQYFKADPPDINVGQSSVLNWNVTNATAVKPSWKQGFVPAKGHEAVSPIASSHYTLTATNQAGSTQASVAVVVSQEQPAMGKPVIEYFKAEPTDISAGQSTVLSWNVLNATSVKPSWKPGTAPAKGHEALSPQESSQYTITATNATGSTQANVFVNVGPAMPAPQVTVDIPIVYAESGTVNSAGASWSGQNAPLIVGDNFENKSAQAFLSFDISKIPQGAAIQKVIVDFSDYHQVSGNPFQSLGCLRAYPHEYGTPDAGDFFVAQPLGAILKYCTLAEMVAMEDEDVKNTLQEKVNSKNNRLKIRLQFNTKTDNDGETDMVMWMPNVHYPKITVTYVPPLL